MRASYEELDDLGGLINSLRAMAELPALGYQRVFLENGATAIEGLLAEVVRWKMDFAREREQRRLAEQALADAFLQIKAANDPAPGAA